MASFQSKLFDLYIRFVGIKRNGIKNWSRPKRNPGAAALPSRFKRKYTIRKQFVHNRRVYTITPKSEHVRRHILYFHGGAYADEMTIFHWRFIDKIIEKSGCRVSMIEYPLTPEHTHVDTFNMVTETYEILSKEFFGDQFVFMGDSAGGGLSLALSQRVIKIKTLPKPVKLVLISPWVDAGMTIPVPFALDKMDYILNIEALKMAGRNYAGSDDIKNYLVSPIYGDFNGIPEIGIWVGTSEIFLADMPRLKEKFNQANVTYEYFEAIGMQHDYPIFPIPEGKKAVEQICAFINSSK